MEPTSPPQTCSADGGACERTSPPTVEPTELGEKLIAPATEELIEELVAAAAEDDDEDDADDDDKAAASTGTTATAASAAAVALRRAITRSSAR